MPLEFQFTQLSLFIYLDQKLENVPRLVPYSQLLYQFKKNKRKKQYLQNIYRGSGHFLVVSCCFPTQAPPFLTHTYCESLLIGPLVCPVPLALFVASMSMGLCFWYHIKSLAVLALSYHLSSFSSLPPLFLPHMPPCCLMNKSLHSPLYLKDSSHKYTSISSNDTPS